MDTLMLGLADEELVVPVVAIGGGILVAVVGIVFGSVQKMVETREREASRREIAAYVAEGSMTAEEGARLLAKPRRRDESASC